MGEVVNSKQVFFIGAWRAQQYTDQLLKQISRQISSKKGFLTDLKITTEGLELHMYNANGQITRHDKIALENIVDFIDNKYSTTCTLAIVRDKQQKLYTVFVFICKSDKDAAVLIQLFKDTKGQLSGEGYNFDLTPKGHNWLLQEKSEPTVHKSVNGDIKVFPVNSLQESSVRVNRTEGTDAGFNMSADTHSRTSVKSSSTEVREELSNLADEVRGIKRLLEGSRGRAKFENHYGYRILSGKKSHIVPVTTKINEPKENVQPAPVPVSKNGTIVYGRSSNHIRYPDGQQRVIVTRGSVPRSTRRYRSDGHVLSVSPTRAAYTKRVYESRNPYAESSEGKTPAQPVQQVRYVTQQPPVLIPRIRSRGSTLSYGSDVVHKSIENVYRSRPSRRVYLPPHPTSPVFPAEAIYTHEVRGSKHTPHAKEILVQKQVNGQSTVHVKYDPEVRTFYDSNENEIGSKGDNDPNISTNVNVSVIENLDDKERRQEDKGYVVANVPTLIVQSENEISRSAPMGEANVHVVRVESNKSINQEQTGSIGNGVYHVKAEHANGFTNGTRNNEDIVVIQSNADEFRSDYITTGTGSEQQIHDVVNDTYDATEDVDVNDDPEETGLFESYVKKPEEYEEQTENIVVEKAVRYHEDDGDVQVTVTETEQSGEVSAENISEPRDQEDNEGLFGAYTESPEEFDEPKSTIIAERTFRYHDDERERTEDDDNETSDNEKHVRYNENVEQIPVNGNDIHVDFEERNLQATYEADEPIETTEFGMTHAVTDRVQQLNAKTRTDSVTSDKEGDEEEEYKLDMDALKVYTSTPDVVIIESNGDRKVESVTRDMDRVSITDDVIEDITDSSTMRDIQRSSLDIQDDVKDIAMSDKVKLPVTDDDLQAFAARKMEGTSIHDDIVDEIRTRGENTVLF